MFSLNFRLVESESSNIFEGFSDRQTLEQDVFLHDIVGKISKFFIVIFISIAIQFSISVALLLFLSFIHRDSAGYNV